jgi:hypothetical protein
MMLRGDRSAGEKNDNAKSSRSSEEDGGSNEGSNERRTKKRCALFSHHTKSSPFSQKSYPKEEKQTALVDELFSS